MQCSMFVLGSDDPDSSLQPSVFSGKFRFQFYCIELEHKQTLTLFWMHEIKYI